MGPSFTQIEPWSDATLGVMVCDDYALMRRRLLVGLEAHPDLVVVAECAEINLAAEVARPVSVDVVVTGNMLPPAGAAQVLEGVRASSPAARGVVLGLPEDRADIVAAVRHGALAFIARDQAVELAASAVRRVYIGLPILPAVAIQAVTDEFERLNAAGPAPVGGLRPPRPSDRELEVLGHLASGASWQGVAEALEIPPESAARLAANALARLVRHQELVTAASDAGLLGATP